MLAGRCICPNVSVARPVGQREPEPVEKHGPTSLVEVKSFGYSDVLQVLVVSSHKKWLFRTLQPMALKR